ncbi:hypothetical protein DB30_02887 [Enhygromyxa salina]|uniref:Uncharacterized protein n=1 Tax=Enhygromyxa salina TaxID=215803 RepID=A0A0C1ZLL4_9BACT|nr:hypothetical protein DB30_02887 [Enhygromyxa salina]
MIATGSSVFACTARRGSALARASVACGGCVEGCGEGCGNCGDCASAKRSATAEA